MYTVIEGGQSAAPTPAIVVNMFHFLFNHRHRSARPLQIRAI